MGYAWEEDARRAMESYRPRSTATSGYGTPTLTKLPSRLATATTSYRTSYPEAGTISSGSGTRHTPVSAPTIERSYQNMLSDPNMGWDWDTRQWVGSDVLGARARREQAALQPSYPYGPGPGGGGSGGGGYGFTPPNVSAWLEAMRSFLGTRPFQPQAMVAAPAAIENLLRQRIAPAIQADQASARSAFNVLQQYLQANQSNPYADLTTAVAPKIDPGLANFIASQGGDVGAYAGQVGEANAGAGASAANWANMARLLGGNVTADQAAQRSLAEQGLTQALQAIAAQRTGLEAAADMQDMRTSEAQRQLQLQLDLQARAEAQAAQQQRAQVLLDMLAVARDAGEAMPSLEGLV